MFEQVILECWSTGVSPGVFLTDSHPWSGRMPLVYAIGVDSLRWMEGISHE